MKTSGGEAKLRGAFKDAPKHKVVEWFWSYVATLSHAKKAELLRWATGSARCPLGGFAKLHGRDGVLRPFTLTSVELAQCAYPRAHAQAQPHRPAFIRVSAIWRAERGRAGPAARRGLFPTSPSFVYVSLVHAANDEGVFLADISGRLSAHKTRLVDLSGTPTNASIKDRYGASSVGEA